MAELVDGQIKGQLTFLDGIKAELEDPSAKRAFALLELADELGWKENPFASFTIRLTHPDGLPFYATWHWSLDPDTGKRSYRFAGARAANMQALAYRDIKTYLEDPRVILPEMPDELCEAAEHDNPDQTLDGALEALRPLSPSLAPEWSVLRG